MRAFRPLVVFIAIGFCCSFGALGLQLVSSLQAFASGSLQASSATPAPTPTVPAEVSPVVTEATPVEPPPDEADHQSIQATPTPSAAGQDPLPSLASAISLASELPNVPAKAAALMDLMNGARVKEGLGQLHRSEELEVVALARANNLVANGYFDHYAPDGESAFSELAARGIAYRLAGENLARNNYADTKTVQAAFDGLMASPGHRANILEERFTQAGVAAVQNGRMWIYVTVFAD